MDEKASKALEKQQEAYAKVQDGADKIIADATKAGVRQPLSILRPHGRPIHATRLACSAESVDRNRVAQEKLSADAAKKADKVTSDGDKAGASTLKAAERDAASLRRAAAKAAKGGN